MKREECLSRMIESGVVAVIRATGIESLIDLSSALIAGGVVAIEITMSTPNAIERIAELSRQLKDDIVVGVGTVIDPGTAAQAMYAGAEFVVSPTFEPDIVATIKRHGKIAIPGAFTPTEILKAWSAGADIVKVFPSTTLGPGYFKDILAPLPQLRLTPTGGVDLNNAGAWIKAGASCLGVGSALVSKEALENKDWATITTRAKALIEAVKTARN